MSIKKRKKLPIKEAKVVLAIKKYFDFRFGKSRLDWNKIHVSPLHNRGFPDIVAFTEVGTWILEVKAPGNEPTKLQLAKLQKIRSLNHLTYWVDCNPNDVNDLYFRNPTTGEVEFSTKNGN